MYLQIIVSLDKNGISASHGLWRSWPYVCMYVYIESDKQNKFESENFENSS